jgi:hypothetical protein
VTVMRISGVQMIDRRYASRNDVIEFVTVSMDLTSMNAVS